MKKWVVVGGLGLLALVLSLVFMYTSESYGPSGTEYSYGASNA